MRYNLASYKKYLLIAVPLLAALLILFIIRNNQPRFVGSTPGKEDIAEFSTIKLRFNKIIENRDEIVNSLEISPSARVDVAVDDDQIIIVPLEYYKKGSTYTISIKQVGFANNSEITNYSFEFKVLEQANKKSSAANVDEGDFIESKYPELAKLAREKNDHYRISYELGDTLIISIEILEIKKIDEEISDYYVTLDKYHSEVINRLKQAGINLEEVTLSYPNSLQRSRYLGSQKLEGDGGVYPFEQED